MSCITLVPCIFSMNRVPHTGSHVWVSGKSSQVRVACPVHRSRKSLPGPVSRVPGSESDFSGMLDSKFC